MNKIYIGLIWVATLFAAVACSTEVEHEITQVASPVLVSSTPASEASGVELGEVTISLTYDKNVFFASKNKDLLSISNDGSIVSADVIGSSPTLVVVANCPSRNTTYTLSIPEGLVTGPNEMPAPAVELSFTTQGVDAAVNTLAAEAQKVYDFLVETYEQKTISGTMAQVNWNTDEAVQVNAWTGKYPALNCFDYIHLYESGSGSSWIDYGDITPVQEWWDNGGLVAAMWHWNVPKSEGSSEMSFNMEGNSFNIDNAFTEGTWEYTVVNDDLAKVAGYL